MCLEGFWGSVKKLSSGFLLTVVRFLQASEGWSSILNISTYSLGATDCFFLGATKRFPTTLVFKFDKARANALSKCNSQHKISKYTILHSTRTSLCKLFFYFDYYLLIMTSFGSSILCVTMNSNWIRPIHSHLHSTIICQKNLLFSKLLKATRHPNECIA